jgi:hypothetical protein
LKVRQSHKELEEDSQVRSHGSEVKRIAWDPVEAFHRFPMLQRDQQELTKHLNQQKLKRETVFIHEVKK